MRVPFFTLARQVTTLRDPLTEAFRGVLESGNYILGECVARFEAAFAASCEASHAIGVASGTDAITIALMAVGVGAGDEVITTANTCIPTVAGIEAAGATVVLVDADPLTYTMNPAALEAAVTDRTRAVVPVHLYGRCADMASICEFADAHDLVVVEDAAQAHGAEQSGRRIGTFGAAAAFSFYPTKNIGALGDGGAVVTTSPDVAARARMLRTYGERERHHSEVRGLNSRLDELQAAFLEVKLGFLEEWNGRRRSIAAFYDEEFDDLALGLPRPVADGLDARHLYVVRRPDRDQFRIDLEQHGIGSHVHYPLPVHLHPAYRDLARPGALAVSEQLCAEVVSLPLYPELTDGEVESVASVVRELVPRR